MIPWGTIEALAKGLYDQNKLSSVNKAQSGLLVKRVTSLLGFVKQKESIDQGYSEGEGPELPHSDALHQTLKNAFTLLKEFQGEGAFKTFVKAGGWKSKLDAINKALDEASQKFMINAQMEGLIRQDEYHKAVTDDLMDLKTAMIALLQSGEKTQANTDIRIIYSDIIEDLKLYR